MIVVTGYNGFIGRNLLRHLSGTPIYGAEYRHGIIPIGHNPPVAYCKDASGIDQVRPFGTNMQLRAVVHLGAISNPRLWLTDAAWMEANVIPTIQWFRFCAAYNVPFIFTSSAQVYGNSLPCHASRALEDLQPLNPYGRTKLLAEKAILTSIKEGFAPPRWYVLRLYNVYGPHEHQKSYATRSMQSRSYDARASGLPITVFHHPTKGIARDFIDVGSVCRVIAHLVVFPQESGIFDIGTGKSHTFDEVASIIGCDVLNEAMPDHLGIGYQYETRAWYVPDWARLHIEGFTDAMQAYIELRESGVDP